MSSFFNLDNGVFSFLGKLCDIIFLSVIWVVFCIPVITIGPANTALYYATVKVIRRERGYLFREFFKAFRLNFKRGAIIGIGLTIISAVLALDIFFMRASTANASLNSILFGIYLTLVIFMFCVSLYIFPVLSRFNMTVKQLVKASSFMAIRHLLSTIMMLIIQVAAAVLIYIMPLFIFFIPVTAVLLNSLVMERILKKYTPVSDNEEDNAGKDQWYLE